MNPIVAKVLPKIIGTLINTKSYISSKAAAHQAFTIFCTPRRGRLNEIQKEYLLPAKSSKIELGERTLQTYHWKGNGPTVLLVHGWESNAHRWWKLIEELQKKEFNIIAFDAPGHGASSGNHFSAVLYAEAIHAVATHYQPVYQVAHSVGGLASLLYYRDQQPEALKKLVLLGAASELTDIMRDYQNLLGLRPKVMQSLEQLLQDQYGFTFESFSGAAFAKAIPIPGLIIHDKLDSITPVKASRAIHKSWPQSRYIETEGLGHSLYQESVRAHILSFLAT